MHEQSETVQGPDGQWYLVYGRNTPVAGRRIPGTPAFPTPDAAEPYAVQRSRSTPRDAERPINVQRAWERASQGPVLEPPGQQQRFIPVGPQGTQAPGDLVGKFLAEAGGDETEAFVRANIARMRNEHDPVLRDAEHNLFSRMLMKKVGPIGPAVSPLYSGAKAYAQGGYPGADALNSLSTAMGIPLAGPNTSAPSMGEVAAGIAPLAGSKTWAQMVPGASLLQLLLSAYPAEAKQP